jgi:hypothetical protein
MREDRLRHAVLIVGIDPVVKSFFHAGIARKGARGGFGLTGELMAPTHLTVCLSWQREKMHGCNNARLWLSVESG